jgi:hypothetical protein
MSKKHELENNEAIKNLLIVFLLKQGVDPKVIETATGIPEMTIRGRFPMKLVKKSKVEENDKGTKST